MADTRQSRYHFLKSMVINMNIAVIEETAERESFYHRIGQHHYGALWRVLSQLVTRAPASACQAHQWRYEQARAFLMEAGDLISAHEAERRVLILENPGLPGSSQITTSLYAGLQLVLPGEVAPAHRHSQSALRFVMEGSGAHTSVNGERTYMEAGDFVITPSWHWHDHGNQSDTPMIWLDGLDIPLVTFFDASFAELLGTDEQTVRRQPGDATARYGANMLPVDFKPQSGASPIFNYPYVRTREALHTMMRQEAWDPCHGLKMRYINPATGDHATPTMAAHLQLLPRGFIGAEYRATESAIFIRTI